MLHWIAIILGIVFTLFQLFYAFIVFQQEYILELHSHHKLMYWPFEKSLYAPQFPIYKIAVTPRLAGYNEFVDMLRKKGFPAQSPSALNFDKNTAKDIFHEVFGEDFGKGSNKNGSK